MISASKQMDDEFAAHDGIRVEFQRELVLLAPNHVKRYSDIAMSEEE